MNDLKYSIVGASRASKASIVGVVASAGQLTQQSAGGETEFLLSLTARLYRDLGTGSLTSLIPETVSESGLILYRDLGTGALSALLHSGGPSDDGTDALVREHVRAHGAAVPLVVGMQAGGRTCDLADRLDQLHSLGVSGIVSWPRPATLDRDSRLRSESVDFDGRLLRQAREVGLYSFGIARNTDDVRRFVAAGVDALVLSLGISPEIAGDGRNDARLRQAITRLGQMFAAVAQGGGKQSCLVLGGPVGSPEDFEGLYRQDVAALPLERPVPLGLTRESAAAPSPARWKTAVKARDGSRREVAAESIIGHSRGIRDLLVRISRIAPFDVNVCLQGESGTGKELAATRIHCLSQRAGRAFITLNCGAIPESLLESELFGHERGAFTGADRRRLGKFELAHEGTLFLDEIADLSPHGQVALLRAIQQREITRIGAESPVPADVRIIAASNQNLADLVRQRLFRADLYYRLNYMTLTIPPLRERKEDIPLLVDVELSRLEMQLNRKLVGISAAFADKLQRHGWPGNVRELQQVIGQAALLETRPILEGRHFVPIPERGQGCFPVTTDVGPRSWRARRIAAREALTAAQGNKTRAAGALGITRQTLYTWLRDAD